MKNSRLMSVLATAAVLLGIGAFEAGAQTIYSREQTTADPQTVQLYRDGSKLYLTNDRKPLTEDEMKYILGPEIYNETVRTAITQYNVGKNLMIVGGSVAGAGFTTAIIAALCDNGVDYRYDNQYYGVNNAEIVGTFGVVFGVAGFVVLTVGTPLFCVGKGRLNWAVDDYNRWASKQKPDYTVNFGPQQHGIGLGIRF